MKTRKKTRRSLPQVHILGDLKDVKNLVSAVNKKKTIVLFHDGEKDSFYLEFERKMEEIHQKDISRLEQDYKLVIFSFFPSRKKVEPIEEEDKPEIDAPEKEKKKRVKKEKKDKASLKGHGEQKEKSKS